MRSTMVVLGLWFCSFVFHSLGFHLIPASIVDSLSGFGFYNDVLLLHSFKGAPNISEAYAGHMIISSVYMFASVFLFAFVVFRELLARFRLISFDTNLPHSLLIVCAACIFVGAFFIVVGSESSHIKTDRSFRGMPLWWVLLVSTFIWPLVLSVLILAASDPKYTQDNWKMKG
jgi:hypothetical protein